MDKSKVLGPEEKQMLDMIGKACPLAAKMTALLVEESEGPDDPEIIRALASMLLSFGVLLNIDVIGYLQDMEVRTAIRKAPGAFTPMH